MKNFKQLRIWQKGMEIASKSFQLTKSFPKEQRFELSSQITRAAVSIPSNIAEGSSRFSDKDYARFISISIGSSFELETQLLIAENLNYGNPALRSQLLKDIDEEQKMLFGFVEKLHT